MSKQLRTVPEFLQEFPMSRKRLQKYLNDKELSHIRMCNRIYFTEQDCAEFLDHLHVQAAKK